MGLYGTKFKLPEVQINLKSPQRKVSVGESNQNEFLIQIDASSFAALELSEFEILRLDCRLYPEETP